MRRTPRRGAARAGLGLLVLAVLPPGVASARTFTVNVATDDLNAEACTGDPGELCTLRGAILGSNAVVDEENEIVFAGVLAGETIQLRDSLPEIVANPPEGSDVGLTINGPSSRVTIDGDSDLDDDDADPDGDFRVFFVESGVVNIDDVIVQNGLAKGGDGGTRAGGGLGAGGGLFVNEGASVELRRVSFRDNEAEGGAGGDDVANRAGGGGGGLGGDGGDGGAIVAGVGVGGGGGGLRVDGQDGADGGEGGGVSGGTGGGPGGVDGGAGMDFGGGGGGGREIVGVGAGGDGGYGGGGGGGSDGAPGGESEFGGGDGANAETSNTPAEGGDALGGAIFVREGGELTIFDDPNIQGSGLTGGAAGDMGTAVGAELGPDLYVDEEVVVEFNTLSDDALIVGGIGGEGGIRKTGDMTLRLNGENTYTGPTQVRDGTLVVDSGTFTSESISISDGAVLSFEFDVADPERTVDATIDIDDGGTLRKSGTEKLILEGTTSSDGTIEVVSGPLEGDADSLDGTILLLADDMGAADESVLRFQQDDAGTFTGRIGGLGRVRKGGTGTLVLEGSNSYSGGTRVAAGTLQGDGDSLQGSITVASGATLAFDVGSGDSTFGDGAGDRVDTNGMGLDMDGTVVKRGNGNLILSGQFLQDSETEVEAGTLTLRARSMGDNIRTDVRISGGTLAGDGRVGGSVIVESGAAIAPGPTGAGEPTAMLDVGGDVDFEEGSTFRVQVDLDDESTRDQLAVGGSADFLDPEPRIEVSTLPGSIDKGESRVYTILTSGMGVTGNFPQDAIEDLVFFSGTVALANMDQELELTLTRNDLGFADVASTPNQQAVGGVLDAEEEAGATGDLAVVFEDLLNLSASETRAALDEIGGEALSAFTNARVQNADKSARTVMARLGVVGGRSIGSPGTIELAQGLLTPGLGGGLDRMLADTSDAGAIRVLPAPRTDAVGAPAGEANRFGIWVDGYGLIGDLDGSNNSSDTDWTLGGALGGFDLRLGRRGLLGVAGGYGRLSVGVDDRSLDGNANVYQAFLYGGFVTERFYVGVTGRYAYNDIDTSRRLRFGTIDRRSKADFDGHEAGAYVETGFVAASPAGVQIEPMASFHYTWLQRESFRESGAGSISLDVDDESWNSLLGTLGVRVHKSFQISREMDLRFAPELWARYAHQFGDRARPVEATLLGGGTGLGWRVKGANLERSGGIFGVGWSVTRGRVLSAMIYYDLTWNPDLFGHGLAGGFLLRF